VTNVIMQYWDPEKGKAVTVTPETPFPVGGVAPPNNSVGTDMLKDGAVTTPKIADGAVTVEKLAEGLISFIQYGKFTPLSGGQNANSLTEQGIYLNVGGYSLTNAPRGNYGWMLLVSRGSSNGHHRGAQVYFDHDGFDWRGFDGSTFTDWETCIIKNKITDIEQIADPSSATPEDIATAYNALLAALKG